MLPAQELATLGAMTALRSTTMVRFSILSRLGLLSAYSGLSACSGLTACSGEVTQTRVDEQPGQPAPAEPTPRDPDSPTGVSENDKAEVPYRTEAPIGRPFLIDQEYRKAQAVERTDWTCELAEEFSRLADSLSPEQRHELAAGYREIALMEHASIAAFARFSLQLLALGAPAHLIEATNRALVDETRHARLSFALSSVFSQETEGPGKLSIDGALQSVELEQIAELVLLEGCIGETTAALEAKWASEKCMHHSLSDLLATIADDEQQHSHLAWEFLSWATSQKTGLAEALLARAHQELQKPPAPRQLSTSNDTWKAKYGLVPEKVQGELRQEVMAEVVIPCLTALCGRQAA